MYKYYIFNLHKYIFTQLHYFLLFLTKFTVLLAIYIVTRNHPHKYSHHHQHHHHYRIVIVFGFILSRCASKRFWHCKFGAPSAVQCFATSLTRVVATGGSKEYLLGLKFQDFLDEGLLDPSSLLRS